MNNADAACMEKDPEYRPDAPDGDAAREEEPEESDYSRELDAFFAAMPPDAQDAEDDGSNPFASYPFSNAPLPPGWSACTPPLDAYLKPDDAVTALACADGSFQSFALSPTYEEAIQGARERAKRLSDEMREEAQKALLTEAARRQAVEACWPVLVGVEYPAK